MRQTIPALLAAAVTVSACQHPPEDPRTQPPAVAVIDVAGPGGAPDQGYTGVIRSRVESDLGFRVGGKIVARLVDAGQTVRAGQPLMRLDPADLALGADAQASAVASAKARALQADADLSRLRGLVEQGAVSAQTYDEAKAGADSARAQLVAAEAQAKVAANAQAYAILRADADGVVRETLAEPGQVVAAGQTVVRLSRAGPREAVINLPETLQPAVGSTATASLYGNRDRTFAARLRQLSRSADPVTRTYEARYVLAGEGANAALGATVTVRLPTPAVDTGATKAGVAAPLGALYDPGPGPGVWLVRGDTLVFQPVRILSLGVETATIEGIPPGARIVGLGADHLRAGQKVRAVTLPGMAK